MCEYMKQCTDAFRGRGIEFYTGHQNKHFSDIRKPRKPLFQVFLSRNGKIPTFAVKIGK